VDAGNVVLGELLPAKGLGHGDLEKGICDITVAPCLAERMISTPRQSQGSAQDPWRGTGEDQGITRTVLALDFGDAGAVASTKSQCGTGEVDEADQPHGEGEGL